MSIHGSNTRNKEVVSNQNIMNHWSESCNITWTNSHEQELWPCRWQREKNTPCYRATDLPTLHAIGGLSRGTSTWWLSQLFTISANQDARATWPLVIRCSLFDSWSTKSPICYHLFVTVALKNTGLWTIKQAFIHSTASNFLSDIASWSPRSPQHGSIPTESWQVANCTSPKLAQGARILGAVQSTRWMTLRNKHGEERLHTSTTDVENLNDFFFWTFGCLICTLRVSCLISFVLPHRLQCRCHIYQASASAPAQKMVQ